VTADACTLSSRKHCSSGYRPSTRRRDAEHSAHLARHGARPIRHVDPDTTPTSNRASERAGVLIVSRVLKRRLSGTGAASLSAPRGASLPCARADRSLVCVSARESDEFSASAASQTPTTDELLAKSVTKGRDMRPVVVPMGVTLDGFVHGVKGHEDWGLSPEDDEVVIWKVASLREAGTR
jgi:hypothetical protein